MGLDANWNPRGARRTAWVKCLLTMHSFSSSAIHRWLVRAGGDWEVREVVDFIGHSIEDGTLYFSVRFKDKTDFSLRYACDMFVVGADFCDVKTGDYEMIREYMRPIPR